MTRELVDLVLSTAHATYVIEDGEYYRLACLCGSCSTPRLTFGAAQALTCEAERIQEEGRRLLAAVEERVAAATRSHLQDRPVPFAVGLAGK